MTLIHEVRAGGIVLHETPEASVVTLWGEIDIALRDEASAALAGAFQRDLPVIVDASEVTFLDSAGIAFLVQLCRIGQDEGLSVALHDPPAVVSEALNTLHVHVPVAH